MKLQRTAQLWVSACLLVLPFATACEHEDFIPDPNRPCTHFLRCVHGDSVTVECPPFTVYNADGVCDHPINVPKCANVKHEPALGREEYIQPPLHHQTESGESAIKPNWDSAQKQRSQWKDEQAQKWNNGHVQNQPQKWNNGQPGQNQAQKWNNGQHVQNQPQKWNNGQPGQNQAQQWNNGQPGRNQPHNWNNEQLAQNQPYWNWNNGRRNEHY